MLHFRKNTIFHRNTRKFHLTFWREFGIFFIGNCENEKKIVNCATKYQRTRHKATACAAAQCPSFCFFINNYIF